MGWSVTWYDMNRISAKFVILIPSSEPHGRPFWLSIFQHRQHNINYELSNWLCVCVCVESPKFMPTEWHFWMYGFNMFTLSFFLSPFGFGFGIGIGELSHNLNLLKKMKSILALVGGSLSKDHPLPLPLPSLPCKL